MHTPCVAARSARKLEDMRWLAMLLLAGSAQAQLFTAGIKGGVPITETFDFVTSDPRTRFFSSTKRYIIGTTAELRLPFGVGFEFDALFRKFSYDRTDLVDVLTGNYSASGNQWQFPLLFKYRFPGALARPYFVAGPSLSHISSLEIVGTVLGNRDDPEELRDKLVAGVVVGAGLEIRALFLRISPELRYTRWTEEAFSGPRDLFSSNRNQADFLIGITF
jgi:hypothetical protein